MLHARQIGHIDLVGRRLHAARFHVILHRLRHAHKKEFVARRILTAAAWAPVPIWTNWRSAPSRYARRFEARQIAVTPDRRAGGWCRCRASPKCCRSACAHRASSRPTRETFRNPGSRDPRVPSQSSTASATAPAEAKLTSHDCGATCSASAVRATFKASAASKGRNGSSALVFARSVKVSRRSWNCGNCCSARCAARFAVQTQQAATPGPPRCRRDHQEQQHARPEDAGAGERELANDHHQQHRRDQRRAAENGRAACPSQQAQFLSRVQRDIR